MSRVSMILPIALVLLGGCDVWKCSENLQAARTDFFSPRAWEQSVWLSVPEAPVVDEVIQETTRAAEGTSWFTARPRNAKKVVAARWMTSGLGVYEVFVNGRRVGHDVLKPGFTHPQKTKYVFTYDVLPLMKTAAAEENVLAAEVSAGWWRDKIVTPCGHRGFMGRKSAFRGALVLSYEDGSEEVFATDSVRWKCGVAGSVKQASIFDGETFDAREDDPVEGEGLLSTPEINREFSGETLPTPGAEACFRGDLAMMRGPLTIRPGETQVVDFGQNCAAVPRFRFRARRGTVLTALPGEMLNDAEKGVRGCDGPKGSVYRENLRAGATGMRVVYTFRGEGVECYQPRFTFFGYRYLALTATDDVTIESIESIPVTSIAREHERGKIEMGDAAINQLISNIYWGQLSNYLSVPTDCPQRNERLGWAADTQVFCEAGTFNADTSAFFRKWMRDMRDSCDAEGGFASVAPTAQYEVDTFNLGWGDAGIIVPWTIWKQFGDLRILEENWAAMDRFARRQAETHYDFDEVNFVYADWLSYEKFETCGNKFGNWQTWRDDPDAMNYRRFLAACYWLYDARLMVQMAEALGRAEDAARYRRIEGDALKYIRGKYLEQDGLLLHPMRALQCACVFALRMGIVEGKARNATLDILLRNIRAHGGCLQTGFLGTSFIMDALTEAGAADVAYTLLLQHRNPSWLYSVDQGATTIWERWDSYTKQKGFGSAGMNSFNHYAYGAVLAWIYRTAAGIAADPSAPGFKRILMRPIPDRRLGWIRAEYPTACGTIRSAWRYEGDTWIWEFTVPAGATARVTVPGGDAEEKLYTPGSYRIERALD